jgi:hypothetical protein
MTTEYDDDDDGSYGSTRRLVGIVLVVTLVAVVGWVAFSFLGLGASSGYVTGRVSYNGNLLTSGQVRFFGESLSRTALIGADGTYVVPDCPLGEVKIAVISVTEGTASSLEPGQKISKGIKMAKTTSAIPGRYNHPESANLKYTIHGGSQTINIDLKD